ncbi:MAG: hypothetical protein EA393_01555 [Bacteroidetes bacterium]|nr:MAG: hypothetical protein EA393_01555 [Bacteroidota bacterium]
MNIKNIILYLSALLLGMAVIFSGCEESVDYDYDAIEPIVQGITGNTEVRGGTEGTYRARGRAGSTYEFSSTGAIASVTAIEGIHDGVTVAFDESHDNQTATLTVVETTMGGVVSEPYSIEISVLALNVNITGAAELSVVEGSPVESTFGVDFQYPGASYSWNVTGEIASIVGGATGNNLVVNFDYPNEEVDTVQIAVTVTTAGGNTIEATHHVAVLQFCPLEIEGMLGFWVTETMVGDCPVTAVVSDVDAEEVTITMTEMLDFYTICTWGDSWEVENGLVLHLNEPEGTIHIPEQFYGYSDYPESFWVRGVPLDEDVDYHGVYNFCAPNMTIRIEIIAYWAGGIDDGVPVDGDGNPVDPADLWDSFGMFTEPITLTYTLDDNGKSGFVIEDLGNLLRGRQ